MSIVYLIGESFLKNNSIINLNVEPYLINMAIQDAQLIHLLPTLGSKLYNKICNLAVNGTINDPANINYKNLLNDYLQNLLVYFTMVEVIPYVRYKVMNKSVVGQNSDNSTPVETADLKFMLDSFRNKAEFHKQRLIEHLVTQSNSYPEYLQNNTLEDVKPDMNSYFSGMQVDDDNGERYRRKILGINNNQELNW